MTTSDEMRRAPRQKPLARRYSGSGEPAAPEPRSSAPRHRIVLASSSPRRRELLTRPGIRFTVVHPPEDRPPPPGICAELAVQLIARHKAIDVAATLPPGTFVIAADTMVLGPEGPMGKPGTPERAREMLRTLRGRRHAVLTGVCAVACGEEREALGHSRSAVKMRPFDDGELETYVATGEPLDRAGGYAIQGGAADLVEALQGRVDNVIGLDVPLALRLLTEVGYPDPLPKAADIPLASLRAARRSPSPHRAKLPV